MKSFILAILNNWHVFLQTKLVTVFRNIFILYNKNLLAINSFEELQQLYGLKIQTANSVCFIELSNDLDYVSKFTDVIYLHKYNFIKNNIINLLRRLLMRAIQ